MFRQLTLAACLMLSITTQAANIFLAGDSTMSIKAIDKRPETGWGEILASHIAPHHTLINLAVNGRSTRSFLDQGRWQALLDQVQQGDLVIIQFGHNDQKIQDPRRFTDPWRDYRYNLERFIEDIEAKQATPILLNSITRRSFNPQLELEDSHMPYSQVVRQIAKKTGVRFIDMTALSMQWLQSIGADKSRTYYMHVPKGHENYPQGKQDDTHLNPQGAAEICQLFIAAVRANYPELTEWFITE